MIKERICVYCHNEVFAADPNMVLVDGELYHEFCAPPQKREHIFCAACGNEIFRDSFGALDNALIVQLEGGYGMFVDYLSRQEKDNFLFFIDHECAHKLTETLPWLEKIINPINSHSHTQQYLDANPDHIGWDTIKRNEKFL